MNNLHENQKKIIELLLSEPDGASASEIAEKIGLTKSGAKDHLIKLETQGYITFKDIKEGVGRPKRLYLLTESGNELFPRKYSWLSSTLLEYLVEEMGSDKVSKMMNALAKKVSIPLREKFMEVGESSELIQLINETMLEMGFRTVVKQSDLRKEAVIEAHNCIYHEVAKDHPALCTFDIKLIEHLSGGMKVKLDKCIVHGDSICRFCIKKRES